MRGLQLGCNSGFVLIPAQTKCLIKWSERGDLNSRPPVPQTGALTELRYAPTLEIKYLVATALATDGELPTVCPPH